MDVDTVEQRTGDAFGVARDRGRNAGACALAVAIVAARTCVLGSNQDEVGREGERAAGATDGDDAVFERLAQRFEHGLWELRQFVQEQHATMGKRDLARTDLSSAADQAGVGGGVVRRAEGTLLDEWRVGWQFAADAEYFSNLDRLLAAHGG